MSSTAGFVPRILVILAGDLVRDPQSQIKYGTFITALEKKFSVVATYNANLKGSSWLWNTAFAWHPDRRKWRERMVKNIYAFTARSRDVSNWVRSMNGHADVILQIGVLYNAGLGTIPMRHVIYTDYTAHLSAQKPLTGRSPFAPKALRRWLHMEKEVMTQADHVCVRSELVRASILKDYGVSPRHVDVVGGGVNLEIIPPYRKKIMKANPVVLFIGTDYYRKGGDLVLRAFAKVHDRIPSARLLFVTKDPVPSSMPLEGVHVMPPTWHREHLVRLYEQADVFIMPSRLETWGDVFLEAMAFGLPCIGVLDQAMIEIIRHGETGYLVPPEHVDSLSEALYDLTTNPQKRMQMGSAGYELVTREFTWDRVADRLAPFICGE